MLKKIIILTSFVNIFLINSYALFGEEDNSNWCKNLKEEKKDPICSESPQVINTYLSQATYLLGVVGAGKPYSKDVEGLGNKAISVGAGTYEVTKNIFTSFFPNFFTNFLILKEDKYIVRDWTKLTNFKTYINKTVTSSLKSKSINQSIDEDTLNKIRQITESNQSFILKFKGSTYKELYSYLWKNQLAMEMVFYETVVKKSEPQYIISKLKGTYDMGINEAHLTNIINQLKKAYFKNNNLIECNNSWNSFLTKLKKVVCKYGKKTDKIVERFSCNYKRLKNALELNTQYVPKCGSVQLAPVVKDRVVINVSGTKGLEKIGKLFKQASDRKEFYNEDSVQVIKNTSLAVGEAIKQQKPDEYFKNTLITSLKQTSDIVGKERDRATQKLIKATPNSLTHGITEKLPKISKKIYETTKLAEEVYENTVEACENQSPALGECRYKGK